MAIGRKINFFTFSKYLINYLYIRKRKKAIKKEKDQKNPKYQSRIDKFSDT